MEQCKISKLLNISTVLEFVTKKNNEVNNLSNGQCSVKKLSGVKLHGEDQFYVKKNC